MATENTTATNAASVAASDASNAPAKKPRKQREKKAPGEKKARKPKSIVLFSGDNGSGSFVVFRDQPPPAGSAEGTAGVTARSLAEKYLAEQQDKAEAEGTVPPSHIIFVGMQMRQRVRISK